MEYKEIIEGIKETSVFDFVANNYWKLTTQDLKTICMELDYAVSREVSDKVYDAIAERTVAALEEEWEEE